MRRANLGEVGTVVHNYGSWKATIAALAMLFVLSHVGHAAPTDEASPLKLNRTFSNDMVLQRDKTLKIWGTAGKDEPVTVTFAGQTENTKADNDGR